MPSVYCMKCKAKQSVKKGEEQVSRDVRGRKRITANCPVCDTKMFQYVKEDY